MSELFWSEYVKPRVINATKKHLEIDKEDLAQIEDKDHRTLVGLLVEEIYAIIEYAAAQSDTKNNFLMICCGKFNTLIKKHYSIRKFIKELQEHALSAMGKEVGLVGYFSGNIPKEQAEEIIFL